MSDQKLLRALHNNAEWCARIWQSHGLGHSSRNGVLYCGARVPDFYPNIVTTERNNGGLPDHIADLRQKAATANFSVKDSFSDLDLAPHRFQRLFEAQWLYRSRSATMPPQPALTWKMMETEDDLAEWEAHWDDRERDAARIFLPDLLVDPGIDFWAGYDQGSFAAGYITNKSGPVVGLSNIFGNYSDCIAHAADTYADHDFVGYESGEDAETAQTLGFEPVGKLAVWIAA